MAVIAMGDTDLEYIAEMRANAAERLVRGKPVPYSDLMNALDLAEISVKSAHLLRAEARGAQ